MGSKGRNAPPHLWRPPPGPAMVHPDPYAHEAYPPPSVFPPFNMMSSAEVMEQKFAAQHVEMQRIATQNLRLAATHGTLRHELAGAQHELQFLHAQIGTVKSKREQQMKSLQEKVAKMETELQAAEPVKLELQQARTEVQNLMASRQELISKVQQISQDFQRAHADVQHIPALMSELEGLRQEYQHCRENYDYERKLYSNHLESLQVMEKNYMNMAREVEKLHAELMNPANVDKGIGGIYGGQPGNAENEASGHPTGQNTYGNSYGVSLGRGPLPAAISGVGAPAGATPTYGGPQSGAAPGRDAYDSARVPGYDPSTGPAYDVQMGQAYNAQRGSNYDVQRAAFSDAQRGGYYVSHRGTTYDVQRGTTYDVQRGAPYDTSRSGIYDAQPRTSVVRHGHATPTNNAPYGSATPPAQSGSGHETPRVGNPARR